MGSEAHADDNTPYVKRVVALLFMYIVTAHGLDIDILEKSRKLIGNIIYYYNIKIRA